MKKYLILLLFLVVSSETRGQVLISLIFGEALNTGKIEFGLVGGYNYSTIAGLEANDYIGKFNLGFYFDVRVRKPWYVYTGVMVKQNQGVKGLTRNDLIKLGATIWDEDGVYSQITKTFLVPALIRYRGENNIFVEAGMQFGLSYDGWIEFNHEKDMVEARVRESNKEKLVVLDAGLLAGIGYKFKHENDNGVSLAVKYYYGLINAYKGISGTKNSSVFMLLTIPVGAQ